MGADRWPISTPLSAYRGGEALLLGLRRLSMEVERQYHRRWNGGALWIGSL